MKSSVNIREIINGFYPILDPALAPEHDAFYLAEALLSSGSPVLQLRQKKMNEAQFLELAMQISYLKLHNNFKFIINSFIEVAKKIGADGVHLPSHSATRIGEARELMGPKALIGVSVHSLKEAQQCERAGADYLTFGAIYPTSGKEAGHPIQGIHQLTELARNISIPVVAIGGITQERLPEIKMSKASAFSALSPIYKSEKPAGQVEKFCEAWATDVL